MHYNYTKITEYPLPTLKHKCLFYNDNNCIACKEIKLIQLQCEYFNYSTDLCYNSGNFIILMNPITYIFLIGANIDIGLRLYVIMCLHLLNLYIFNYTILLKHVDIFRSDLWL